DVDGIVSFHAPDEQQNAAAVWEHERPTMRCLPSLFVEARSLLKGTAACGNTVERSKRVRRKDDLAILSPRRPSGKRGVCQHLRRATIKIDALHLSSSEKANRLAIRR